MVASLIYGGRVATCLSARGKSPKSPMPDFGQDFRAIRFIENESMTPSERGYRKTAALMLEHSGPDEVL